jgi:hypothetical protein
MAKLRNQAAQLGIGTFVAGLKAVRSGLSKRKYKRLLATAVAQLLATDPDLGRNQAVKWARRATGVKPSKKLVVKPGKAGLKEGLETAAVAAAGGAALKAVGKLGRKVADRIEEAQEAGKERAHPARQA